MFTKRIMSTIACFFVSCSLAFLLLQKLAVAAEVSRPLSMAMDDIKRTCHFKVILESGYFPFEMKTTTNEFVGFDVDMAKDFAVYLAPVVNCTKLFVDFLDMEGSSHIPMLNDRSRAHAIISGMTITAERGKVVLFSKPYYQGGLRVLIGSKYNKAIKNIQDLDSSQYSVVTKLGATSDIWVTKNLKKAKIKRFSKESDAASDVLFDKTHGFIYDKPFLELYAASHRDRVFLLDGTLQAEAFGIAAHPTSVDLISHFNSFLENWNLNGGYKRAIRTHFEDMPWKKVLPGLK